MVLLLRKHVRNLEMLSKWNPPFLSCEFHEKGQKARQNVLLFIASALERKSNDRFNLNITLKYDPTAFLFPFNAFIAMLKHFHESIKFHFNFISCTCFVKLSLGLCLMSQNIFIQGSSSFSSLLLSKTSRKNFFYRMKNANDSEKRFIEMNLKTRENFTLFFVFFCYCVRRSIHCHLDTLREHCVMNVRVHYCDQLKQFYLLDLTRC